MPGTECSRFRLDSANVLSFHQLTNALNLHIKEQHAVKKLYSENLLVEVVFLLLSLLSPLCSRVFTITYLKQPMFLGYTVLLLFVFTICATREVISPVKYVLYFYISTFRSMCAVPNTAVFLLQYLNLMLSCYIAQVLSEWFWNGSSRPYY
jgi:hypothetical protein